MDQEQIDKLRAAGYSDDDIRDYVANQPKATSAPTQTQPETLPEVDVNQPSEILRQATAAGVPTEGRAPGVMEYGTALVSNLVTPTNVLGAYGAYKLGKEALGALRGPKTVPTPAVTPPAVPPAPVAPTTSPILDAQGRPIQVRPGPVAPASTPPAAPTAQAQPSLLDKTTNMVRQLAANKVFQNLAKGGAGVAAAFTPGNVGQDYMVPQTGRMRGMEINPMTGRPWTKEQLQAYNANPAMYDSALGAAQMPR